MFATKINKTCYNITGDKMLKKYKVPIIFSLTGIIVFTILFFSKVNSDLMWNFGYSYNTSIGRLMYKDFNMVISPLYPTLTGLLMHILGNNMISFTLINTVYVLLVIYIIYKLNPKIYLISIPFVLISCLANYNTLCILFALLIVYLEKREKNDYLIGFIIALAFLTKINAGIFLAIPSLFYIKKFNKIIKRFIGFIIPNIAVALIFLLLNNLKNYISYVFLGVLDFASNNLQFSLIALIVPIIVIYLVYLFIKEKNIVYLYSIFFTALIYPVMNELHVIIALIPAIIVLFDKYDDYIYKLRYSAFLFIFIPIIGLVLDYKSANYTHDKNLFKYRPIQSEYVKNKNDLDRYFNSYYEDVCFLLYDNYLYKLMLDLPINKYDVILYGNLGYKGTDKMINYLKSKEKDHYFVVDSVINGAQYNEKILNYVQTNYKMDALVGNFYIFKKK